MFLRLARSSLSLGHHVARTSPFHSSGVVGAKDVDKDDGKEKKPVVRPASTEESEDLPSSSPGSSHMAPRGPDGKQILVKKLFHKPLESTYEVNRPLEGPVERTFDILKPKSRRKTKFYKEGFDAYYDVCIIGGGLIGCSVAYFLAERIYKGMKICVIERDPTYRTCSSTLSVGGLRQQFSTPENVMMSLYGADFLRQAHRLLYVHGIDLPEINFQPHGYLYLATERGAETMERNHVVQTQCGAKVELMSPSKLSRRFPWLNTEGIALGSYGYENEGWFDPWALLSCLRLKAMHLGVHFVPGEVYNVVHQISPDFRFSDNEGDDEQKLMHARPQEAHVHLLDGDVWPITAGIFIIAAGPDSGHVAHLAGIGAAKKGILSIPLPIEPRKRYVYCAHVPGGGRYRSPGLDCPLVIDPSGAYMRREGYAGNFLMGRSPPTSDLEPGVDDLEVDEQFFHDHVWPVMANRVPALENLKVKSSWAGYYDYNYWDQNAIVGRHPHHKNIIFASGFSGHGVQQAPAIGRAVMELVMDDEFKTIDLTDFGFQRVLQQVKVEEECVV